MLTLDILEHRFNAVFEPPPDLSVSEWSDEYRKLSAESSAEPGQWHTARAEYQRGIMDACNDPNVETIVVMSSAQVGKTEIVNNIVGYYIDQDPAPVLVLQPTLEMAKTWSKDRLAPMVRDTPTLKGKIKDARSRDAENTVFHKKFTGGHITMAGANSPASLASRPIRTVLCDEVDRYPISAGTEGDPVNLAKKRTTTFWNRKIVLTSTPTVKGASRIETAYNASDQRRFFVPCPHCGEFQHLQWRNVKWSEDMPVYYACDYCGAAIEEREKTRMVSKGEWRATAQSTTGKTAGFHLNELYSPWVTWADVVASFLEAKKMPDTLQVWVNTSLGETWEEQGEGIDSHLLQERAEDYNEDKETPSGVLVVTIGADVQDDRLECEVVGWGIGEESWSLGYYIINGDPEQGEVWRRLDDILDIEYRVEGLPLRASRLFVDSGYHTESVYKYSMTRPGKIYPSKGQSQAGKPVTSRPAKKKNRYDVKPIPIGTDTAKDVIYGRFKIDEPGPGYCHFPNNYEDEFYKQITAEEVVIKHVQGVAKRVWKPKRKRNEALDCRVYAYAALHYLRPQFEVMLRRRQKRKEAKAEPKEQKTNMPTRRHTHNQKRGGFVNGWR